MCVLVTQALRGSTLKKKHVRWLTFNYNVRLNLPSIDHTQRGGRSVLPVVRSWEFTPQNATHCMVCSTRIRPMRARARGRHPSIMQWRARATRASGAWSSWCSARAWGLHSVAQRVQRSLGDGSGSMAWLRNTFGAMLGLGQPAVALAPPCTPARARRPDGEDDGVEEGAQLSCLQPPTRSRSAAFSTALRCIRC